MSIESWCNIPCGAWQPLPLGTPPCFACDLTPPTATGLAPNTAVASAGAVTFSVNGTGFSPNSVIYFDGAPVPTVYVSSTQVRATVTGTVGVHDVQVYDPASGYTGVKQFTFT